MTKSKKCPTPWKQSHATKGEAQRHTNSLYAQFKNAATGQHPYRCPCGAWHVGGRRKRRGRRP